MTRHLPLVAIVLAWAWLTALWASLALGDTQYRMSRCPYERIRLGYTCTIRHWDGGHTEARLSNGELVLFSYPPRGE